MLRTLFVLTTLARAAAFSCWLIIAAGAGVVRADEIKFLCASALRPGIAGLVADFENSSGHKVTIAYGTVGTLTDRVRKGEAADVAIVSGPQLDELQREGKIIIGSRIDIAKVGVGIFVRPGAAKPDISSVDAFTRALLTARSVTYRDPSGGAAAGVYMPRLLDRLGIAAAMQPKTKLIPNGGPLYDVVASGEVEIGLQQISEIIEAGNVELAGPLPTAIQNYTLFAAGIVAISTHMEAGKALIGYLSSPAVAAVLRSRGFELP